ncbi:MAG: xanthine dehydrogenase family protein molybdopterin-binding subunit [Chloroflexi bacterium]|nr:MAG: xanthine dehydrogenase family protein molybdopterin-binding subunit [Chloroflexota bacterium]
MGFQRVDAFRVAFDPDYASSLTDADWAAVIASPEWHILTAENFDLLAPVMARFSDKLSASVQAQTLPPRPIPDGPFQVIGKPAPRLHGFGHVTGFGQYTEHMSQPGMLFMRSLLSPHPHARIRSIDTSKAEAFPGVVAVLHRGNLPDLYKDVRIGSGPPDRFLFSEEIFEVGAPIAVVAAASDHIADEATRTIAVDYEVLPAVLDHIEGMKPSTPKQWDNKLDGTILDITPPKIRGNPDQGFAESDVVLENVTTRSAEHHAALEPTTVIAKWDYTSDGRDHVSVVGTFRHAHGARNTFSQALKLNQSQVRVITPGYVGASYGSHRDPNLVEIHALLLAKLTGRPVRAMNTRAEDFVTRTHRTPVRNESKIGVKRDGTIVAFSSKNIGDAGAQRGTGGAAFSTGLEAMYSIPNLWQQEITVMTNSYKYSSLRCTEHPNNTLAREPLIDRAAYAIGMNPLDIRLKNLNLEANPDTKQPYNNSGLLDVIQQATDRAGWKEKWHPPKAKEVRPGVFHGIGMAAHSCVHGGGGAPSTGMVVINSDGTMSVISGAAEVGPGERTTMAMMAAEVMGLPLSRVRISVDVDSDVTSDTGVTAGSRQTISGGWGVYEAAQDARTQLLDWAVKKLVEDGKKKNPPETVSVTSDDLSVSRGVIVFKDDPNRKLLIADVISFAGNPVIGRGAHIHETTWQRMAWAAGVAELEVDTGTGSIKVLNYVAAHDVGRAINPLGVKQQIEGGAIMGIGQALTETLMRDNATGVPLNPNLLDYKVMSIKDVPPVDVVIVEKPKNYGAFGAHGIGEPPIASPASAIINAVYNAVGVWVENIPLTRARVLAALKSAS